MAKTARSRGRPAAGTVLTAAAIARAARELLGEDGLDGLSMRAVAGRLGVDASSLYWHVRNKDALLDLVADDLIGRVPRPSPELPWRDQLAAIATAYRGVLLETRDAARIMAGRWPAGTNTWRALEGMLAPLLAAGFPPRTAAHAAYLLHGYVTGFVLQEQSPMNAAESRGESAETVLAATDREIRSLPAGDYPSLHATADALTAPTTDERFDLGLALTLDGLSLRVPDGG